MARQDAPRRLDSVHAFHLNVHDDNVGVQFAHHLEGARTILGLAYHLACAVSLEHRAGNVSEYRLVVDKEN